jgi:hypothetical protein
MWTARTLAKRAFPQARTVEEAEVKARRKRSDEGLIAVRSQSNGNSEPREALGFPAY